jgi:hypothetical protein
MKNRTLQVLRANAMRLYCFLRRVQFANFRWLSGSVRGLNLPRMVMIWPSFRAGTSFGFGRKRMLHFASCDGASKKNCVAVSV